MIPYFATTIDFLLLLLFTASSHSFLPLTSAKPMGPETDRLSLLALKHKLTNGNPQVLPSWNSSLHFCKWEGVSCTTHTRVSKLNLTGPGLDGSLSPAIGNLTFLQILNITHTRVHGEIPKEIGRLKLLLVLFLQQSNFQGEIPIELVNCTSLELISFNKNNLTGKVPPWLGSMRLLIGLYLDDNKFFGDIPLSLGNLSSLKALSLPGNNLQGSIPQTIGRLTSLNILALNDNNLSGTIHSSLPYNLSNLQDFDLAFNLLSGTIPSNIDHYFPIVQNFWVGNNSLTGTVPPTFSNISQLKILDLNSNRLRGPFPTTFGRLQNLRELIIEFNFLGTGSNGDLDFISSLTNCSQLLKLSLQGNGFGGALPKSIGNFTSPLNTLLLGSNKISGSIPEEIGKLVGLTCLQMNGNFLQGEIPVSIGRLKNLQRLFLGVNQLSGNIPTFLGNLTKLFDLYLNNNNFEGGIRDALRHCRGMQYLFLSANNLSGNIPNDTFGQLEDLISLDMSKNSLIGILPSEFGNLKHLYGLSVIDNKLSGDVPRALGGCSGLSLLYMGGNLFQGSIPSSFGLLKSLEFLNLSRNNLSGTIPNELKNLPVLKGLDLSFNHLHGEVPKGGVFDNITSISLTGNEDLCGGIPQLKLPTCSNKPKKHFKTFIILIIGIGSSFICFVVFISIYYWRRRPNGSSSSSSSIENGLYKVSYRELHDATNGFSSSNLVGSGSFGSVYRGTLHYYHKPIVVKVLNLQAHGASKSFVNECRALSEVRHRNLLKILTCCSSVNYKGDDFMALVFEFMPNGNLENWLSTNGNGESRNLHLDFHQRLNIAIDLANALDYLHHDCEVAVVHCDIKPNNVLLDDEMVAHLGDFGLAKLLHGVTGSSSKDQTPSSEIKGTIGYIPPEYGAGGPVTAQGDIYSYGVLLLELLTGKKPTDSMFGEYLSLHKFCNLALSERSVIEIVDSRLLVPSQRDHMEIQESLINFAKIGVACSVDLPNERMGIKDVLVNLLSIKKMLSPNGINMSMQINML